MWYTYKRKAGVIMKWIDFQCEADDAGLQGNDEIDAIEMIGKRYDICYTEYDSGYQGVIEIWPDGEPDD